MKKKKKAKPSAKARPKPPVPEDSLRDTVTDLYNRNHLIRRLQENMARCDRSKEMMVVVLWDIDGFSKFNNRYGQKEGDKLLQRTAGSIRRSLRVYDEAFRSGNDEFCALLVPADSVVADEVMRRVSQAVSSELFEGDSRYADEKVSISVGVAYYPGPIAIPEGLLHAAAQSLYKNKISRQVSV